MADTMKEAAPVDGNYWTYWVHKVQELWKRVEELEVRMDAVETVTEEEAGEPTETAPAPAVATPTPVPTKQAALTERELTVCMALKEIGHAAALEEINNHLKTTRMISEGLRETLVNRLKGAVEKGYAGYDEGSRAFSLLRKTFVVE